MPYRPYVDLDPDDLSLRDKLAADRTVLANERTLLAHIRTALGLLGGGGALVYVSDDVWLIVIGAVLLTAAPLELSWGAWRYLGVRRRLRPLLKRSQAGGQRQGRPTPLAGTRSGAPEAEISRRAAPEASGCKGCPRVA